MKLDVADFELIAQGLPDLVSGSPIVVGVSGGPDSMALCHYLSQSGRYTVHAISVDHALRPESADEARTVGAIVDDWPRVYHSILRWDADKPESRILEEARNARYHLIQTYMKEHGIGHLFVAHHRDDQAETFLMRLAKGSGLDGLAGMKKIQRQENGAILCRPFLDLAKDDLVEYCRVHNIQYVQDPSNENEKYLRPRLRAARDILAEEGLTSKRLAVTASRLGRARAALESLAHDLFTQTLVEQNGDGFIFDWVKLKSAPEELILRVMLSAVDVLKPDDDYGPRMEKMENLMGRLLADQNFKSATLAGCLFAFQKKNTLLSVGLE